MAKGSAGPFTMPAASNALMLRMPALIGSWSPLGSRRGDALSAGMDSTPDSCGEVTWLLPCCGRA